MGKALVTLVNPNKIHPPVTPYALDILTTSLEVNNFDVEVVDLTFCRENWRDALSEYFATRSPLLVGVTIRNTDTIYPQEQKVFLGEHRQIIDEINRLTSAPIVVGGVGFSSMPFAAMDYFGVPYGVKGPGETILCQLADALLADVDPGTIPGLIINYRNGRVERVPAGPGAGAPTVLELAGHKEGRAWQVNLTSSYIRRSGQALKVDNAEYYQRGGLGNILTKNGCAFSCSHCVEPDAKGNQFARRPVNAVVDEMELLASQGVYDLHTTDSEFNLAIVNSKDILREIIRRKDRDSSSPLRSLRLWIYTQPAPFDAELADLLSQVGGGVNVGLDHVRDDLLNGWKVTEKGKRFYNFGDVVNLVDLTRKYNLPCMVEALLGMPGETLETVRDCIDRTMALNATVVGFTLGLRIFPYSPLGMYCAALSDGCRAVPGVQSNSAICPIILRQPHQCSSPVEYERQFMFEEPGTFRPLFYFSPDLPESPETIARPNGRWLNTLRFMWDYIPASELPRVMLPTVPGLSRHDNNYADNPFLLRLVEQGYKGAFWSRWRDRDRIMREAASRD
jgi:tryptophan 2-C-methyltransferase